MHSVTVIGASALKLNMSHTSTLHSFIPPSPFDLRSPCPALNALANHGYMYAVISLIQSVKLRNKLVPVIVTAGVSLYKPSLRQSNVYIISQNRRLISWFSPAFFSAETVELSTLIVSPDTTLSNTTRRYPARMPNRQITILPSLQILISSISLWACLLVPFWG